MIFIQNIICDRGSIEHWKNNSKVHLVDLREFYEEPIMVDCDLRITMDKIISYEFNVTEKYVLFCQTGQRAKAAAIELNKKDPNIPVYYFEGGVEDWVG